MLTDILPDIAFTFLNYIPTVDKNVIDHCFNFAQSEC